MLVADVGRYQMIEMVTSDWAAMEIRPGGRMNLEQCGSDVHAWFAAMEIRPGGRMNPARETLTPSPTRCRNGDPSRGTDELRSPRPSARTSSGRNGDPSRMTDEQPWAPSSSCTPQCRNGDPSRRTDERPNLRIRTLWRWGRNGDPSRRTDERGPVRTVRAGGLAAMEIRPGGRMNTGRASGPHSPQAPQWRSVPEDG